MPKETQDDRQPGPAVFRDTAGMADAGRVLIVDDEPHIAEALAYILRRDGWQVEHRADGEALVDTLLAQPPDVLILDAMLPGASGFDLMRAIRSQATLADLPSILLTAKGQEAARAQAMAAGATMFMAKPFANADLVEAVRRLGHAR